MADAHKVVIIGGGFGGLSAARTLKSAPVQVTLVDRCNYHLFQPLLYQVATGSLSPANVAGPLRQVLRKQENTQVLLGEAIHIDPAKRRVILSDGAVDYDTLIVATGATHQYFGHDEWEQFAPGLKNLDDATAMRGRILLAFEAAERERDAKKLRAWMTFVIVGAGPTGAELAGALGEIAHDTLRHDFRAIDPSQTRIILVEGADRALPAYPPKLSEAARRMLVRLGVTVRTGAMVTDVRADGVTIRVGDHDGIIPTKTVLWAAGVLASPLGVIVAQPAIQQGHYAAKLIRARLRGKKLPPFHYFDKGNLATIGRGAAVADLNWLRLSGWPAWLIWVFVHLLYIVQFQNRLLVMLQWAWLYITFDRSARLITGKNPLPLDL